MVPLDPHHRGDLADDVLGAQVLHGGAELGVGGLVGDHDELGVSISTVRQEGRGADAQLVVVSHAAPDAALRATVDQLRDMDIVREVTSVMRVEGGEE